MERWYIENMRKIRARFAASPALRRLGLAIRENSNIEPMPKKPIDLLGRYRPEGWYMVDHRTGKPIVKKEGRK